MRSYMECLHYKESVLLLQLCTANNADCLAHFQLAISQHFNTAAESCQLSLGSYPAFHMCIQFICQMFEVVAMLYV